MFQKMIFLTFLTISLISNTSCSHSTKFKIGECLIDANPEGHKAIEGMILAIGDNLYKANIHYINSEILGVGYRTIKDVDNDPNIEKTTCSNFLMRYAK